MILFLLFIQLCPHAYTNWRVPFIGAKAMAEALKQDLQIYGTVTRVAGSKIILPNTKYPREALQI